MEVEVCAGEGGDAGGVRSGSKERKHKQSKHKFDRKRMCEMVERGERTQKSCQSQNKKTNKEEENTAEVL